MPHECTDCGRQFADGSKEMLSGCPDCGGNTFQFRPQGTDSASADANESRSEPSEMLEAPPEPAANSTVARTVGNAATAVRDLVGSNDPPAGHPMAESGSEAVTPRTRDDGNRKRTDSDTSEQRGVDTTKEEPDEADDISNVDRREDASDVDRRSSDVDRREDASDADRRSSDVDSREEDASDVDSREDTAQASARSEIVSPDDLPPAPETSIRERPAPVVDESSERTAGEDRPNLDELRKQLNQQFESIRVVAPGQYELNLMELFDREEYIIALQEDGKYTIQVPERWNE